MERIVHMLTMTLRRIALPTAMVLVITLGVAQQSSAYLEDRPPVYLEAKVGSYVILNCPVDFPKNDPIPYVLHWNKDVSLRLTTNC